MSLEAAGAALNWTGGASTITSSASNPRKRQRTLVSCTECHRRKQKCDRQWPCGNCKTRSASHLCQYERRGKKNANASQKSTSAGSDYPTSTDDSGGDVGDDSEAELESMRVTRKSAKAFGYTMGIRNTSLNVLEKLDIDYENQLHPVYSERTFQFTNPNDLHTYNNLIRLIPARPFTNLLIQVFFTEVNFTYGTLHQPTFNRMLDEWWNIATSKNNNPGELPTVGKGVGNDPYISRDIHFFPSLLLQVLGSAIQLLPREHHEYISQIKLGMSETLSDFSSRLSNASCELATLLGGTFSTSINRVIQPFLRASWLMNEGRMHETWHSLGTAIRNAQELGLHLHNGPSPRNSGTFSRGLGGEAMRPAGLNNMGEQYRMMWYKEMEKRVWINLYLWERYISMVLGRPPMINDKHCTTTVPIDCEPPEDLTSREPTPRGDMDPPSSFTQRILDYRISLFLNEIEEINQTYNTTSTPDFVRVDNLHARIMEFTESFPPEFNITNRDTSYDKTRPFLAVQAAILKTTFFGVIVSLHRPYLFLREESRKEIVRAGLIMLECQEIIVKLVREHHHRSYTFTFFTFDPCIVLAAVVITNVSSLDQETVEECLVALRAGWRRLRMFGACLRLAEKAAVVIRVLLRKVESVVERLRWSGNIDEINNDTSGDRASDNTTAGLNTSPGLNTITKTGGKRTTLRSRSSTRGNGGSRRPSPASQHQSAGRLSPHNASASPRSSSENINLPIHHPNPHQPANNGFLGALNAASSFNSHHHHRHQQQQQQQNHQHHPTTTTAPSTLMVWDNSILIDLPVNQLSNPQTASTTGTLIPGISSASPFDFSKPTCSGGFPGFFDDAEPVFPMGNSDLGPPHGGGTGVDGIHGVTGPSQNEIWEAPSGDGLWQNLLGIYGNNV